MTVQTETSRSGPYAGSGTTGPFTVGFRFLDNTHLQVIRTSSAGVDSTLVITTDYSVSGAGGSSGTVTLVSALAVGETLTVIRDVPFTQLADYVDNDAFPAESHENALDLLTMQTQQNREVLDRSLTLPATTSGVSTELPVPESNKLIGWNETADALQNIDSGTLATIVAYGTASGDIFSGTGAQTVFTLGANPGALYNLDVSIGGVDQRPTLDYTWSAGTTLTFTTAPVTGTDNISVKYKQALPQGTADAAAVSYLPAGTGAVATNVQSKLLESVSVRDFGAVGDGVTDDTTAIRAAFAAVMAATKAGNSGIYGTGSYVGSAPILYFPVGVYKITDYITADTNQAVNYQWFKGEQAIIVMSAGVTAFGGIGYVNKFEGLIFRGGACAISIKTNNVDSTTIDVANCEFHNQSVACIQSDATSNSTLLNVSHSKFIQKAADGYVLKTLTGDQTYFRNNWVTCGAQVAFYNGTAVLTIAECLLVPVENIALAGGRWVDNYNTVTLDNVRFGGEGGGATLVRNFADMDITGPVVPTKITVRNCTVYIGRYVIEFYKLPNAVEFVNNYGMPDSDGFYFDSGLTNTDFTNFARHGRVNIDGIYPINFLSSLGDTGNQAIGDNLFLTSLTRLGYFAPPAMDRLNSGQLFGSGYHGGGWSNTSVGATSAYVTNDYGYAERQYTITTDAGYFVYLKNDYLVPTVLTYGKIYTLITNIEGANLAGRTIKMLMTIGGVVKDIIVENGRKVYCIPFVYLNDTGVTATAYDKIEYAAYELQTSDVVTLGRHTIVEGNHSYLTDTLVLKGTASPAAVVGGTTYNQGYMRGDTSYRTNVAASGFIGDVCTTAGNPGTWKTFGPVSA